MIRADSRFKHHPDVAWRLVQEDALLVDPRNGRIYPLNPVSARIWTLLGADHQVSEIVEILINEFDAPSETVREDAIEFIANLLKAGLVIEIPGLPQ
mgnify:CR=1 FL=1